jgi:NAD(P) transhydrogenase
VTPSSFDYDLIVIGSGPAGQRAALQGAKAKKKVLIIDMMPSFGGGCVHSGTLPSKSFRESVYRYSLSSGGALGQESESAAQMVAGAKKTRSNELPDMTRLLRRRNRVVDGESQVIYDQLKRNHITLLNGRARLEGPHEVEVDVGGKKKRYTGLFVFVAVGARPVPPAHIKLDHKVVLDSDSILSLKKLPKTMIVLGAGVIGCEYASMFSMAGTKVTLVDKRDQMLAAVDREIVRHLVRMFTDYHMDIVLSTEASEVKVKLPRGKTPGQATVKLTNGQILTAEAVLVAMGRTGNTETIGLRDAGVKVNERGLIEIDEHFRTSVPSIYAVGDVIGPPALASTSMEQGRIACCHAFGIGDPNMMGEQSMPKLFPYGIYTIPEISMVGLTEEELKKAGADFVVGRAKYKELARGQIVGDRWGLLKLLVDRKTLKLLGVHIIGDNAADLIHIGQAVMDFGGDARYFIRSVFNYPTLAEAYKTAAFHAVNQILGVTRTV